MRRRVWAVAALAIAGTGYAAWRAGWIPAARPDPEMQAQLAKARAEAEEARRALVAQRVAEARAKREAELVAKVEAETRAKVEAETRAKLEAEAAAKAKAVPAKPQGTAARYDGNWTVTRSCDAILELPAQTTTWNLTVTGGEFVVESGKSGRRGSTTARGRPAPDGTLKLDGTGIASAKRFLDQPYTVHYEGKLEGDRFVLKGRHGQRPCSMVLARK
jgi:hypothetical protein